MLAYQLLPGQQIDGLHCVELPQRALGAGEVRVRVHAVSLSLRDLAVAAGDYVGDVDDPIVPCSDGAGEVLEVGAGAQRFRTGERVVAAFFPRWIDGPASAAKTRHVLGGDIDGMLAREVCLDEDALVAIPEGVDYVDAATLPYAGVTAWNALFETHAAKPGDAVLLLGTGDVSILGLQLARAAGLRVIITSSSNDRLRRACALGAHHAINYHRIPEWHEEVLRATGGCGADVVLDVGGKDTVNRSVAASAVNGTVALIGGVGGGEVNPAALVAGARRMAGVCVGSRSMLEHLLRFVQVAAIRPVVERVFAFDQAREAYRYMASGSHFGKVVIALA